MREVFEFLDYRDYLKEFYRVNKKKHSFFSYKFIGDRVGMDPSYFAKILIKSLHISDQTIPHFIKLLKLSGNEAEYFEVLVHFGKSKTEKKSKLYFEKLIALRKFTSYRIEEYQYTYYSKWYYSAIRSLLGFIKFTGNYKDLASLLTPAISVKQAKEAIALLLKLNMISVKDAEYTLTHDHVSTGKEFNRIAIEGHQKSVIQLALDSMSAHSQDERNFGTLTMAIDKNGFNHLEQMMRDLRESIQKYVNEVEAPDRVYQLNMQFFPLSKPHTQKK